ncbi:NUDIX hydrolase [Nonomuraea glycinis]|uniref:NUDIX hydrolase n=1 Tax=Nonomuraea glycinis TaxID=2047744 RepID=A0A918E772_9ACTN|nr:NUDIX hydrolase [Nonomuraea glycinis]MCA2180559.1 NUDIX hydrolase [Nonomuraea glycinis]GGP12187.1 NUDIX hydrolase [Nonomuraea glycinis]
MTTTDPLRAAGAVVWRGAEGAPEVAVVHRPRYDDWTFPKGKLEAGEHVIAAALREVREETGLTVTLGRPLPAVHYPLQGALKRVDYWTARVSDDGGFVPGDEVDELRWVCLDRARELLSYAWDVELLGRLTTAPLSTVPLVLVRHGSAGSRQSWQGEDARRPLDDEGLAQAAVLATVLPAYRPEILLSSPSLRCVQTLRPYSSDLALEPLLSEETYDPPKTTALVGELTAPAVVCSHGKVLPSLIAALSSLDPFSPLAALGGEQAHLAKGAFAVLHRLDGRVIGAELHTT